MDLLNKIRPAFWNIRPRTSAAGRYLFNYRRIWKWSVFLISAVAILPLVFITALDYRVTERALESEFRSQTAHMASNTHLAMSFFLSERKSALNFIVHDNPPDALNDENRLAQVLKALQQGFGEGFVDLGIIDSNGEQKTYVGPYSLHDKDYREHPWFRMVVNQDVHISDVFLGYRQVPHLIIAVKQHLPDGSFQVLRASLGIGPFQEMQDKLSLAGMGDVFLINKRGVLQTDSRYHGKVFDKMPFPVPDYDPHTQVIEGLSPQGEKLLIGYRFIEGTPFILMIVKHKKVLLESWRQARVELILFLLFSVTLILAVILGSATYMVRNMHLADEKRLMSLHHIEYANKMASIGRMAATVAHEINNPLAIINEKAGLIKDLFTIKQSYSADTKLIGLVDAILNAVRRAGKITKQLLAFSRNLEASVEIIHPEEVVREVLVFLEKVTEMRGISVKIYAAPQTKPIRSDRGKLQQIFLNIINNAYAAMPDNGNLTVHIRPTHNEDGIIIRFCDDGCGIEKEDLNRIFEPFFSTKTSQGGTGLGLSITYNLVHEIGGKITVSSEPGEGTCFTITLPASIES
jgi:signal transduction histidine kinase